ncbi:UDP-N-acetylmuramate dehydrogenase [Alloalcanivorax xenomutans]|uniref:UDP-N-acetylmuramate dehydrogenase n=1 Tax=Alloalcanivorax xenomutans TaxID=1094342 RepID=UPI0009B62132|nr:UDP-N-acetylmuramate dehydrogenase [Alloalcanivorax xenomutans]
MARLTDYDVSQLEEICPEGVERNVSLAAISQWKIGGNAELLLRPTSTEQLAKLRTWMHRQSLPHVVIGATTNLLFADEGLHVPCIQIGAGMSKCRIEGGKVYAQAGVWVPGLARRLMKGGLTGAEHICGIPGTLGGLVCMNGGSQRKGISNNVEMVESVDSFGNIIKRPASDCNFKYRHSVFRENREIISSIFMRFHSAEVSVVRKEMLEILKNRSRKFPRKTPNCGSVFKSNPAMYETLGTPGAIIERLGFKGMQRGGAIVSPIHANFILNVGGAKAADVLALIKEINNKVAISAGDSLDAEVCYVSSSGAITPADKAMI